LRDAGIAMRPSLLPFTPWSTFDDFVEILDFVESEDLVDHVDPVQYTIRLLVPPGSLLLEHLEMQPHLGPLDEEHLTHRWTHPDPRMDALQEQAARTVEDAAENAEDAYVTFHRIRLLTRSSGAAPRRRHPRPPRLTESWFC
ncbi:MAG: CUAEP/CCAEP-tail radical SAM protein, partial [Candidatus Krumholzibacteriia bacterium]